MLKMKPALKKTLMAVACLSAVPAAQAAISLDRTRAIFNGGEKSMTLNVANDNKQLPYLAQAWIENEKQEKSPPDRLWSLRRCSVLSREPKVWFVWPAPRISANCHRTGNPLFYFNLREIPPKSDKANVLQIALQTKIKLFYRPKAIEAKPNAVWQDQLVLNKTSGGYRIENPTPYYVTVIGLGGSEKQAKEGEFEAVMLAPKSTQTVKSGTYSTPYLSYINDYGGRPVLQFSCSGERCTAVKK